MFGKGSVLTREGAEAQIARGGSVLHGGMLHTSAATLPETFDTSATEAPTAPLVPAETEEDLDAQIEALEAKRKALRGEDKQAEAQAKADAEAAKANEEARAKEEAEAAKAVEKAKANAEAAAKK